MVHNDGFPQIAVLRTIALSIYAYEVNCIHSSSSIVTLTQVTLCHTTAHLRSVHVLQRTNIATITMR